MPQKCVSNVRYEVPVTGEGVEGYKTALDKAGEIVEAIKGAGAVVVSHTTNIRQVKALTKAAAAPAAPAHGHLLHP